MDIMTQAADHGEIAPPAEGKGQWADLLAPRYAMTTSMLCLGVALYAFNGFLVTTSLPTAVEEFGGAALISWALTLYLAASIVAGASAALLKQALGGKATLLLAALLFLAGTLIAGLAENMATVLLGRILQGIGEGIVAAVCYALIPEMYPEKLIAKVFGAEAGVWAVAAFGAPVLAGWLTETISWRAAFLINVPMILIFLALALVIAPRRAGGPRPAFRLPGLRLTLLSLGLLAILFAGVSGPLSAALLSAVAAVLLIATILFDKRAEESIMPAEAFSLRSPVGLGLWVVLMMPVAQATSGVYLVYGLQHVWSLSPTAAGALYALMAISWSTTAILVANIKLKQHTDRLIWLGPLCQIFGLGLLFSAFASGELAPVFAGQLVIGAGFGMSWAYLSKMTMEETPLAERDKTSALLPTLQSAGFALGGGLAGLAANSAGLAGADTPAAIRHALTIVFLIALLWSLPAVFAARQALAKTKLRANE
ncbi:MFS transporter [Rhizobium sp. RU36D]|uniref:MFS transporter n=1 Tax=Rhizobium sp. RU36D TaxID=1907415 RepID=UPI0009D7D2A6|nr:MFS transporter [Rhizobium sp. RU36D]SMC91426.1 Major Facilitator Superfamily protein [Rhizobium sp. RU36D]